MPIDPSVTIHPTAVVDPRATIGARCVIGPYCIVGPHVVLGEENELRSHVVLEGHTTLGDRNQVFQFASLGSAPQDLKYRGEPSTLVLGSDNVIREYVTLQPGTKTGHMTTVIGSNNLFMANTHVGHDCVIGNHVIMANSAALSGHVTIGNHVTIGGLSGVHQYVRLGDYCMLGGGSMVTLDVPPYLLAQGDRAGLVGVNRVGLERHGFSAADIGTIRRVYRKVFLASGSFEERVRMATEEFADAPVAQKLLEFLRDTSRGVMPPRRRRAGDDDEG